jgi:hypothetical protein
VLWHSQIGCALKEVVDVLCELVQPTLRRRTA